MCENDKIIYNKIWKEYFIVMLKKFIVYYFIKNIVIRTTIFWDICLTQKLKQYRKNKNTMWV